MSRWRCSSYWKWGLFPATVMWVETGVSQVTSPSSKYWAMETAIFRVPPNVWGQDLSLDENLLRLVRPLVPTGIHMGGRPVKQRVVDKTVSTFDDAKHDVHHHTQKCCVRLFFSRNFYDTNPAIWALVVGPWVFDTSPWCTRPGW